MTSFIISNNNKLLLLPSLNPTAQPSKPATQQNTTDHHHDLNEFSIKQLLKADLSQHKRNSQPQLLNNWNHYTYNDTSLERLSQDALLLPNIHGRRSSQFSSVSSTSSNTSNALSTGFDDQYSSRSRSSIFSNESDDNGFSSSSSDEEEDKIDNKQSTQQAALLKSPPMIQQRLQSSDEPRQELIPASQFQEAIKRASTEELNTSSEEYYQEVPARSKRQRIGPSCDLCRSKKIKCDAHVEIMELDVDCEKLKLNKKAEIQDRSTIGKYLAPSEIEEDFKLVFSNEKIIKFKSCSYCIAKGKPCVYRRGYTKDDILRYNLLHNIKKKKKTSRVKKRS